MVRTLCILLFLLSACTKKDGLESVTPTEPTEASKPSDALDACRKDAKECASIDIENAAAQEAYQIGCDANNFYSCFRLGQYHEVKSSNFDEAVKAYSKSCSGKDTYGCESEISMRSKLCFLEKKTKFCKGEPAGEYRILIFLETLDPKYQDAFVSHNFSDPFTLEQVKTLYEKRMSEKNKKLLAALRTAKKKGQRDGADSEGLQADIWKLEGNEKMLEVD